jgi:hypothetical protein
VIQRHHAIVRDALQRWRGVEIDTAGDAFYATSTDRLARSGVRSTSLSGSNSGLRRLDADETANVVERRRLNVAERSWSAG